MTTLRLLGALAAAWLCWGPIEAWADLRIAARSGGDAPGLPDERLVNLYYTSIDNLGQVAFGASTQNRTSLNGFIDVAFVERTGTLHRIATGAVDANDQIKIYAQTSSGLVLFRDEPNFEGGGVTGLWIDHPNGVMTAVRGDPLRIGGPLDPPATISDNGLVAYSYRDNSEFRNGSVWLFDGVSARLVADGAEFLEPGAQIATGHVAAPIVNNSGDVLFEHRPDWGEVEALVLQRSGDLAVIAAPGNPAVGVAGAELNAIYGKRLNNRGETAFWSNLRGDNIHSLNNQALYFVDQLGTHLIAREDEIAPGVADDARFDTFWRIGSSGFLQGSPTYELNDNSELAFMAWLRGDGIDESNNQGIWRYTSGSPDLVLREGMPAPGGPDGSVVAELSAPVLNDRGQLAFAGKLAGPGVDAASDEVIWATDAAGVVELIVREGDLFPGGESSFPAENRIQRIKFLGGESLAYDGFDQDGANGRASGMNDLGQIAFFAQLYNGEQMIVVSNAVAVPEAATATAALAGLLATLIPGRRLRSA